MPAAELIAAMKVRFAAEEFALGIEIDRTRLLETLRALRDRHGYRLYVSATATDRPDRIEVLHGLRNLDTCDTLWVKVGLPKQDAEVDSAAFLYAGAEWQEREIFDLFGVRFRSHPDLRRILMPDEYEGHPLLKQFPIDAPWGYRPAGADRQS
ncbi:MAG TPA: NADH-quinone oxidoreductase subunit C [Candidatus Polarisedimenticolaceae bacterium]|nr:NADH-quinone oxidoreductase subunit C [Candidatus Polarisedimenticolaceae bacterium]